jgi:squalene synthase HpnC
MSARPSDLGAAYRHCRRIAAAHYENFTVGSWLLPRRLRRHIAAIYAFARAADDFADEGDLSAAQRLARLDDWQRRLEDAYAGRCVGPIFVALADTAARFDIPIEPFHRLLRAFRADAEFRGFDSAAELLDYCRCSADPVGHLILYLFGYRDAARRQLADKVCTGLQLANFWQDISVDAAKGRIYVPREDLAGFGCSAADIAAGKSTPQLGRLIGLEVAWAESLLLEGRALAGLVDRRLGREIYLFAGGGLAILRRIRQSHYDVLSRRPTVSRRDKLALIWGALLFHRGEAAPTGPEPLAARERGAQCG